MTALILRLTLHPLGHCPLPRHLPHCHPLLRHLPHCHPLPSHPTVPLSFAEVSSILCPPVPIGHSSMANTSDSSMPTLDHLDIVPLPSFQVPDQPSETLLRTVCQLMEFSMKHCCPVYHSFCGGSKFGNDMLTDNRGTPTVRSI